MHDADSYPPFSAAPLTTRGIKFIPYGFRSQYEEACTSVIQTTTPVSKPDAFPRAIALRGTRLHSTRCIGFDRLCPINALATVDRTAIRQGVANPNLNRVDRPQGVKKNLVGSRYVAREPDFANLGNILGDRCA